MNRAFRIGDRVQRPKTLDLRRKVLLKNFFRTQNIFVHSVSPNGQETFDFSAQNSTDSEVGNIENDLDLQNEAQSVPEIVMDEDGSEKDQSTSDSTNLTAFSFTTMMVALPDSTSPNCTDSVAEEQPLEANNAISTNGTVKVTPSAQVRVKRKFSLKKPYSFSRRKTKEIHKVTVGMRISKRKLSSVSMKSPKKKKRKRFSLRTRFSEIFTSKSTLRSKKHKLEPSNRSETDSDENSTSLFQSKCTFTDLTLKNNSADVSKSVSVQTDVTNLSKVGPQQDLENQRLRLENKNLKGKLQYLLSLNTREDWGEKYDTNGQFSSSEQVHKKFESNQENKTDFNSNSRLTRSRSVQASSRSAESRSPPKPRYRRARSVCISRDEAFGKGSYRDRHSNSLQPFKPMQSFFYNDGQRKRKVSPTLNSERLLDAKHTYRKRPRSLSTSYDTAV